MRRSILGVVVAVIALGTVPATSQATTRPPKPSPARRAGLQTVPKEDVGATTSAAKGANPFVALLPDPSQSDVAYWRAAMNEAGRERAAEKAKRDAWNRAAGLAPNPLLVDEDEPDTFRGSNDTRATAQPIASFGTAPNEFHTARVLGTIAAGPPASLFPRGAEDNGSIPKARPLSVPSGTRRATAGTIGDGPHGSSGDGTGDFDYYKLPGARSGQRFVVDITTQPASELDSVVILYDAAGTIVGLNDDEGFPVLDSLLEVTIPRNGDYFVSIGGFPNLQANPFDSGSGDGFATEGDYTVNFGIDAIDIDFFAVDLEAGDVLGATVNGSARDLSVVEPTGVQRVGATSLDASGIYPASSPLPGGGNTTLAHVAAVTGRHAVGVKTGTGDYDLTLEVYRPAVEALGAIVPTIFLDFDGARVNTAMFTPLGGVRQLSPLRAFLGRWGLTTAQENELIDRVVATVRENLVSDANFGSHVRILNSRDDPDPFGQPNVSRVVVGGTIAESGIDTIGIAQSIDPGNLELEDTALVLLDVLSDPPSGAPDPSLNAYLRPQSDRVRFVGTAIGNVVSHEAGHFVGNFHVDQFNNVLNLMDQGGNFPLLFGVGPDGIGGTADDPDVDFGNDRYNPFEGFRGLENTAATSRWGLSSLRRP